MFLCITLVLHCGQMIQTAARMSPLWTSALVWLIYGYATLPCEPATGCDNCHRKTCGCLTYDSREAVCCENELHQGIGLACCGKQAFSPEHATCCKEGHIYKITDGLSEKIANCCGTTAFNPLNEICCESTVNAKPSPKAKCCGQKAIDVDNQLCCDPINSKTHCFNISQDYIYQKWCGKKRFDNRTHCCCGTVDAIEIQPIGSSCCPGVQKQKHENQPNCTEPEEAVCGSSCYNPKKSGCCERNQANRHRYNASGSGVVPQVYDLQTLICCDGHLSVREPWMDKCCGKTPYGLAEQGVLCCNNTLYTGRDDKEECSEVGCPYNPRKGTICCSQFHVSPGQHCCGTEIYRPHAEICCNGQRLPKGKNTHCCGVQAYNIKNQQMKCCGGNLYNLSLLGVLEQDVLCCGSSLINQSYVCCSNEDKEILYSKKTGFKCCSHLYYDTSLWSCCAGKLRLAHHPGRHQNNEAKLLSLNNLNQTDLCKRMLIGTVESVSQNSILFRNVLEIHGGQLTVRPLHSSYILNTPDRCNSPKLNPGKAYFFDAIDVFTDYNHDSILQSIHFIFSKCSSRSDSRYHH